MPVTTAPGIPHDIAHEATAGGAGQSIAEQSRAEQSRSALISGGRKGKSMVGFWPQPLAQRGMGDQGSPACSATHAAGALNQSQPAIF